jgi:hypothetical protein
MTMATVEIPYGLTKDQLRITDDMSHADITADLLWMVDEVTSGGELDRIMRAAVLIHAETRHPMEECLHQAIIWERG